MCLTLICICVPTVVFRRSDIDTYSFFCCSIKLIILGLGYQKEPDKLRYIGDEKSNCFEILHT